MSGVSRLAHRDDDEVVTDVKIAGFNPTVGKLWATASDSYQRESSVIKEGSL